MTITKVVRDLINDEAYSDIVSAVGNTTPTIIDSVVISDSNWANTSNSYIMAGDNFKIYGLNFKSGANVKLIRKDGKINTLTPDDEVFGKYSLQTDASNISVEDSSYIKASIPSTLATGSYSLFIINSEGTNAFKITDNLKVKNKPNYGITGGGITQQSQQTDGQSSNSTSDTLFRWNYDTDTMTGWVKLNTTDVVWAKAGSDYEKMYFFKGINQLEPWPYPAPSYTYTSGSTSRKIYFANSTSSATIVNGAAPRFMSAVISNKQTQNMYIAGGAGNNLTGPHSNVHRYDMTTDSLLTGTTLAYITAGASGTLNANYGWFYGGWQPLYASGYGNISSAPPTNQTYQSLSYTSRIDFSSDTNQLLTRSNMPVGTSYTVAAGTEDYGWYGGGMINATRLASPNTWNYTQRANFYKLTYASDTTASVTINSSYQGGWNQVHASETCLYFKNHFLPPSTTYINYNIPLTSPIGSVLQSTSNLYRLFFSTSTLNAGRYEQNDTRLTASTEGYF